MTDCTWYASAQTWIDSNGDGQLDSGEAPLRNVRVHVADLQNQLADLGRPAITDPNGQVQWSVSIPGCANTLFEIYVDVPEGYRITTRPRLAVQPDLWESISPESLYYFGFAPDR